MTKVRLWPIGALALLAGLALAANSLAATTGEDAPADRYFGQQKMSPLSVRQRVDALGRAYAHRWIADGDLLHDATIAGTSLNAWRAAFPRDTWLAPTTFHLAELFADVQSSYARSKAVAVMQEVAKFYGATRYGHLARVRLAAGFPPLHAESAVMPTPGLVRERRAGSLRLRGRLRCAGARARVTGSVPLRLPRRLTGPRIAFAGARRLGETRRLTRRTRNGSPSAGTDGSASATRSPARNRRRRRLRAPAPAPAARAP